MDVCVYSMRICGTCAAKSILRDVRYNVSSRYWSLIDQWNHGYPDNRNH